MTYAEKAMELRAEGCNCCQATLGACCEVLDASAMRQLGAFFAAGMRRGEVCGALSGALMAMGMHYADKDGKLPPEDARRGTELLRAFEAEFGAVRCRELLGVEGRSKKETCPVLIQYCAKYLEKEFSK